MASSRREPLGCAKDEIGGATVVSGLSGSRVRYFALGGTSVYIGDGALSYGGEQAFETYYKYGCVTRKCDALTISSS